MGWIDRWSNVDAGGANGGEVRDDLHGVLSLAGTGLSSDPKSFFLNL